MKKFFALLFITACLYSCTNNSEEIAEVDNSITLRTDTVNIVKLTDTMVIHESTCRGCAYEASTNFAVSDSLDIIKLSDVITTDNNPPDMDGGSISKKLILVPVKTGVTTIRLYKFWSEQKTAKDSANFSAYKIEVK
jgi:hypothetical protein